MRSAESFAVHVRYKTEVWNKTDVGKAAMVRGNATRKERNKQLAAMKNIAVFNRAKFDKVPVQAALMTWGSK